MSTAADLLAAIRATPDDDNPRLVFADFLDDACRPERAEFIRVQCARARLPDWDAAAREYRRRERVLLARHGRDWMAELGTIPGVEWGAFDRGFVAEVRVAAAADFVRNAEAVRDRAPVAGVAFTGNDLDPGRGTPACPWLRSIRLTAREGFDAWRFGALLQSPLAEHIRVLNLSGVGVENAGALAIAAATHLTQLEELDLTEGFVGVAGAVALASAAHLARLRVLNFDSHGSGYVDDPFVTTEGVRAIAASPHLKGLTTLGLSGHGTDQAAVGLLLHDPAFARLEQVSLAMTEFTLLPENLRPTAARWLELDLTYCQITAPTLAALLALPQCSELRRLRVHGCGLPADGLRAVAASPCAATLRELDAARNRSGPAGTSELAAGTWPHLHTLDLIDNQIDAPGAAALAAAPGFPALADLRLGENAIGDAGSAAVAGAPWAARLRNLDLRSNGIGAAGGRALAAGPGLRRLGRLSLSTNKDLKADGVAALLGAEWPELVELDLSNTICGDAAVARLAASDVFPQLLVLQLSSCDLTEAAVRALVAASVDVSLGVLDLTSNTKLGDGGANLLAVVDGFPALRSLAVGYCGIGRAALERLLDSPLVRRVRRLQCWGNEMSQTQYPTAQARAWADLGPDWVADGSEDYDPYG